MAVIKIRVPRYYHTRLIDWLDDNVGRSNWWFFGVLSKNQEFFLNQLKNIDRSNHKIQQYYSNRLWMIFAAEFKYETDAMAFKLTWC